MECKIGAGRRKNFDLRYLEIILYIVLIIRLDFRCLKILKGYPFLFLLGVGVGCSTDEQRVNVVNRARVYMSTHRNPAEYGAGRKASWSTLRSPSFNT